MKTSETTKELSGALSKALGVITNPAKDATNPHFRSKYATLDTGLNVIRQALSANNLSFVQTTRMEGDLMMLDTRLMCGDQWIEGEYPVCKFPAKAQDIGSALTYARRYSLFAIVGVTGEDDDDGNAANQREVPARKVEVIAKAPVLSADDSKAAYDLLAGTLMMADSVASIDAWLSGNLKTIENLNDEHKTLLRRAIKDLRAEYSKES